LFVDTLTDQADKQAMIQALNQVEGSIQEFNTASGPLVSLLRGLRNVQHPEFQRALDALLQTAESIEEAKLRLASWFDRSMEHVTDTYRRMIQTISLGVGLALALLLNVDTLQVARSLWDDPSLRQAVVAAANTAAGTSGSAQQPSVPVDASAQAGAGFNPVPEATPQPGATNDGRQALLELGESAAAAATTVEALLELNLPIGWYYVPPDPADSSALKAREDSRNLWNYAPGNNPETWFLMLLKKLAGIALTTIAVSQGAPFWFDLMNRIARGRTPD
jgi:hypothetical protein